MIRQCFSEIPSNKKLLIFYFRLIGNFYVFGFRQIGNFRKKSFILDGIPCISYWLLYSEYKIAMSHSCNIIATIFLLYFLLILRILLPITLLITA